MEWQRFVEEPAFLAAGVLIAGLLVGYFFGRLNERLLRAAGVPGAVEGTPFERSAQSIGTSTVNIIARLSSWFVYGIALLAAVQLAQLLDTQAFWLRVTEFVPRLFLAVIVLIVGFVVADKVELIVSEYLRSVKLPEVNVIPRILKYSVLYVAFILALGQVGVNILALLILLTVYAAGLVLVGGYAFKDFLVSGAAGIYLLLNEPYSIGDKITVDDRSGIVQEIDIFVTTIETDTSVLVIPNRNIFERG
ncbi:MAG: mechanosensitive ion channel [Natrialbaceae archaeon]|nr:mechanosensitive ion channel [Natrialbaceae archaeon]